MIINDEYIIQFFYNSNKLNGYKTQTRNIEKLPEIASYLINRYEKGNETTYQNIIKHIKGHKNKLNECKICGKVCKLGQDYCSHSCYHKDHELNVRKNLKSAETKRNNEKINPDYYKESKRNTVEKTKITRKNNLEKDPHYYDEATKQIVENRNKTIRKNLEENPNYYDDYHAETGKKCKETKLKNLEKDPHYYDESKKKCKETIEKHISKNPNYYKEIYNKSFQTRLENRPDDPFNRSQFKETLNKQKENEPEKYKQSCKQRGKSISETIKINNQIDPDYYKEAHKISTKKGKITKDKIRAENPNHYRDIAKKASIKSNNTRNKKLKKDPHCYDKAKEKIREGVINYIKENGPNIAGLYKYKGLTFDSSWELVFYIKAEDDQIDIIRSPKRIPYFSENKKHYYCPDFLYNNQLVEIKGDYMLDENNHLIDYKTGQRTQLCIDKENCMLKNKVILYKYKDIKPIMEYINDKYGKNYINQFKINVKRRFE